MKTDNIKENIIGDLQRLPVEMNLIATQLYTKRKEKELLDKVNKTLEFKTILEIEAATDNDGKKKYSNQTHRDNEREFRLSNNDLYQQNKDNSIELAAQIDSLSSKQQFMRDQFDSAKALSRLVGDK